MDKDKKKPKQEVKESKLTYRQLKSMLSKMTDKQLDSQVAVVDLDDYDVFLLQEFVPSWKESDKDIPEWLPQDLDPEHPFLPFSRAYC